MKITGGRTHLKTTRCLLARKLWHAQADDLTALLQKVIANDKYFAVISHGSVRLCNGRSEFKGIGKILSGQAISVTQLAHEIVCGLSLLQE